VDYSNIVHNEDFLSTPSQAPLDDEVERCVRVCEVLGNGFDEEEEAMKKKNEIVVCSHGCFLSTLFQVMNLREVNVERWWMQVIEREKQEEEDDQECKTESTSTKPTKTKKQKQKVLNSQRRRLASYFDNCELKSGLLFFIGDGWEEEMRFEKSYIDTNL